MAKANITEYDSTAGNNTVINDIDISEGCSPSTINNAIRELMAHLKNVDTGSQALTALSVTGNVSVGGTFTSRGIDDNADATAITIDSSENVMIGKTSTNFQTVGVEAKTNGSLHATADQNNPIVAVRKTNDGKVQAFYKDATEVGQIGSYLGAYLYMGSTGGTDTHINFVNGNVRPATSSGGHLDNSLALGHSSSRWSDVYVGGNIYLGGTGSANALDDYEEGTFVPKFTFGGGSSGQSYSSVRNGFYTKIGRVVYVTIRLELSAKGSSTGTIRIADLPFALPSTSNLNYSFYIGFVDGMSGLFDSDNTYLVMDAGTDKITLRRGNGGGSQDISESNFGNSSQMIVSGFYHTA